jgi:hypothetical protein
LNILILNKAFLLGYIFLDVFKEQVDSHSLCILNLLQLSKEAIDVGWWVDLDALLLALVQKVLQLPFGIFALFDLCRVWQVVW